MHGEYKFAGELFEDMGFILCGLRVFARNDFTQRRKDRKGEQSEISRRRY